MWHRHSWIRWDIGASVLCEQPCTNFSPGKILCFLSPLLLSSFSNFQELSNPQVRPHLHIYPEDSGDSLGEARQAAKWLHELPSEDTTPMIRLKDEDYYIHEPVILTNGDACVPARWFTRDGVFHAKAWPMERVVIEGNQGWCVREDLTIEVSEKQLLKNFPGFMKDHTFYNMPNPSHILGMSRFFLPLFLCLIR